MPNSGTTANYGLIPNPDGAFGLQATQEPRIDADTMLPELDARYQVADVADWVSPTINNAWTAVAPVKYYKDRGRVYIQGTVTGGAAGDTLFTLPAGYRPSQDTGFASAQTADGTTYTHATIVVTTGGAVVMADSGATSYIGVTGEFRVA